MSDIKLPRRLDLSVQYACNRDGVPSRVEFRRWLRAAEPGAARVTVRIVDEDEGRELNRDYRGKDYATNVLTFAYGEGDDMPLPEGLPLMGDLVLCRQVVEREAAEQGKALDAHYAHLSVHGMLHLQGFDHLEDAEADEMEARERQILAGLGYADPYAGER
ncbi:rRNA maturation RNase YbeY [Zoogloea sp.]|jgi:probable rRNA maturation factor|uniref:rRNA maturation RNase YbeY n=1 Tax=Zoogloea sp. TaxID=49181 RepID=UPI0025E2EAEA|nr:rRNA maturation RNase YbeY [Zoogloea sp.]MCK6392800.1 rRNA maturation RNase YbeY [Zoogloea sp.]